MAKKPKVNHGDAEAARHGIKRSNRWPAVERKFKKENPICAVCGEATKAGLQVHHIFPFHFCVALGRPDLELDQRNLITLCETEEGKPGQNHHLDIGHLNNFKSSNLNVVEDATKNFYKQSEKEIETSQKWLSLLPSRLKALDHMTDAEKRTFTVLMNKTFPPESVP